MVVRLRRCMLFWRWIARITTFCRILRICREINRILWTKLLLFRKNLARISTSELIKNASSPANSLLGIPGKLLENQICSIIDSHLQACNLLSEHQWGFRKGLSTEDLLLVMTEKWKLAMDKGQKKKVQVY